MLESNNNEGIKFYFRLKQTCSLNRKSYYNLIKDNDVLSIHNSLREKYDIEEKNSDVWLISFNSVSEIKLIQLQWKLLHNIYPSGTVLYKMKIRESENCLICDERDSPIHCFVFCSIAIEVWKAAENIIFKLTDETIKLNEKIKMIGMSSNTSAHGRNVINIVNKICLIAKFTISKFRLINGGKISILFEKELLLRNMLGHHDDSIPAN